MPVLLEFLLVAALIYFWESALWLPKRGLALRRSLFGKHWRVIPAARLFSTRELGFVPMLPLPPDSRLVPCSRFPVIIDESGAIYAENTDGDFHKTDATSWEDIRYEAPNLIIGSIRIRCQSPDLIEFLKEQKSSGLDLRAALVKCASESLSPARAKRAMKLWRIVSEPLRTYCPFLTLGFFAGIPAAYIFSGPITALMVAAWLWLVMIAISISLYRIAKYAYPTCRKEIRQDAFLSLFVPFHAMRAMEIISVHVFARHHPLAILFASGTTSHPWLDSFMRSMLHPRPGHVGDAIHASAYLPEIEKILRKKKIPMTDFDTPPDRKNDPEATLYCPRCHHTFLRDRETCPDCMNMRLKPFE